MKPSARSSFWPALVLSALLAACAPSRPAPAVPVVAAPLSAPPAATGLRTLQAVDFTALDGWLTDDLAGALPALRTSCDKVVEMTPTQPIGRDGLGGLAGDWLGPCGALRAVPENDGAAIRAYFAQWFQPYRVTDGTNAQGLFTGYYEPELKGARKPDARFRYPLLSPPPGLPHGRQPSDPPYYTRGEIEAGALKDQAQPLVWVDDAVDLHILQIQGSGRVVLGDGTVLHVHYAGDNGWPFVGIGKVLIERGKLPPGGGNMVAARNWLKAHPDEAPALMAANPRYIFFRLEKAGPIGAEGVVLTAGRSLAVDPRYIPLGAPLWLQSVDGMGHPLQRLFVAQDTGSAITGVVRGDVYWGSGEAAFQQAGLMRSAGRYFLLLPRTRGAPLVALPVSDNGRMRSGMNAILPPVETAHAAVMKAYAEKRLQIHLDLPLLSRPGSPAHDALDVFVPLLILMPSSLTLLLAFNILVWIVGLSLVLLFQIFLSPSYVAWRTKQRVLKALEHLHNFQLLWSFGGIALTVIGQTDQFCLAPTGHWREFAYRYLLVEPAPDAGDGA